MKVKARLLRISGLILLLALAFTSGMLVRQTELKGELKAELKKEESRLLKINLRLQKLEKLQPEIGDEMRNLQIEAAKLWYAEKFRNHDLALYELKEMKETIETIGILNPIINGVNVAGVMDAMKNSQVVGMEEAIRKHHEAEFKRQYDLMLQTCNSCHRTSGFGFNKITIPQFPPVPNQDWKPLPKKG